MVLFSSLDHGTHFYHNQNKIQNFHFLHFYRPPMGVCGIFRPPVQGGSNELISKFLSSMILYNHPSYFKSGEINSCRLSPLPTRTLNLGDSVFPCTGSSLLLIISAGSCGGYYFHQNRTLMCLPDGLENLTFSKPPFYQIYPGNLPPIRIILVLYFRKKSNEF